MVGRIFVIMSSALLLAACGVLQPKLKHYQSCFLSPSSDSKKVSCGSDSSKEQLLGNISFQAFVTPKPVTSPSTLLSSLSPEAQAALVRALAAKSTTGIELVSALSKPYVPDEKACAWASRADFQRQLVLSIVGGEAKPSYRLALAKIGIAPYSKATHGAIEQSLIDSGPFEFVSWDRFETKYLEVNLGSGKFTQSSTIGANKGAENLSQIGTTALADKATSLFSFSNTRGLEESFQLSQRIPEVSGVLAPKSAQLFLQGAPGRDILGTTFAVVTVRAKSERLSLPIYSVSGFDKNEIAWQQCWMTYPSESTAAGMPPNPIVLNLKADGVLREVGGGADTYLESDDAVTFRQFSLGVSNVVLVPSTELNPDAYSFEVDGKDVFVSVSNKTVAREWLLMKDGDVAAGLLATLRSKGASNIGGRTLELEKSGVALTTKQIERLSIRHWYVRDLAKMVAPK